MTRASQKTPENGWTEIHRTVKARAYPDERQQAMMLSWQGPLRYLWNICLEQTLFAQGRSQLDRKYPSATDQMYQLTELRTMASWLDDVPRDICNQVVIRLGLAWSRCFMGLAEAPTWKRKDHGWVGLTSPDPGRGFKIEAGPVSARRKTLRTLTFPKLGQMNIVLHRELKGELANCTMVRDGDQWFACLSYKIMVKVAQSEKSGVGIDRGVYVPFADSDGRLSPPIHPGKDIAAKLAAAQRSAANKVKGSQNEKKAKLKVTCIYRTARRQREAATHRESAYYTKNHGTVVLEALIVPNMTRSAKGTVEEPGTNVSQKSGLNRAILDVSWGNFDQQVQYKSETTGTTVIKVPPKHSSNECAECGHVDPASRVSRELFVCVRCHHEAHADTNAARVIYRRRTDGAIVCAAGKPGRPTQKLRVVRRGTRRTKTGASEEASPFTVR